MNKTVKIIIYVVGFFMLMGVVDMCSSCGKKDKKSRDEIINEAIAPTTSAHATVSLS